MKITIWSHLKHFMRFWCGPKLIVVDGEVLVEYKCLVCAKRDVKPSAWKRLSKEK